MQHWSICDRIQIYREASLFDTNVLHISHIYLYQIHLYIAEYHCKVSLICCKRIIKITVRASFFWYLKHNFSVGQFFGTLSHYQLFIFLDSCGSDPSEQLQILQRCSDISSPIPPLRLLLYTCSPFPYTYITRKHTHVLT